MENKLYVTRRNQLIPLAEKEANEVAGERPFPIKQREAWINKWNTAFFSAMDRMAKELRI